MEAVQEVFEVGSVGNCDKITPQDLKFLISFYEKNPVLWNQSHPHYRNHALKNKAREVLMKALGNKYRMEILEKKFHSLRTSMRREVKRNLETDDSTENDEPATKKPKKPWVHYEGMMFMKEEIERGNFTSLVYLYFILTVFNLNASSSVFVLNIAIKREDSLENCHTIDHFTNYMILT
jgi:hypothetical protein